MRKYRSTNHQKKSLKQGLKDLLRRKLLRPRHLLTTSGGTGLVCKGDPSAVQLGLCHPNQHIFPQFECDNETEIDEYSLYPSEKNSRIYSYSHTSRSSSRSLLPATSLSQCDLRRKFLSQCPAPHVIQYRCVEDQVPGIASYQASLASSILTLGSPRTPRMRIRSSCGNLRSRHGNSSSISTLTSFNSYLSNHSYEGEHWKGLSSSATRVNSPVPPIFFINNSDNIKAKNPNVAPIYEIDHFKSFCVLDTGSPGYPIRATSRELRHIFDVGEPFFLNTAECEGTSMDVVTGTDAFGNQVTHLVLFSALISPSSGRSRFMLASLVDVSQFLRDTVSLSRLDPLSVSDDEDDLYLPRKATPRPSPLSFEYHLSAEDLLGGCSISPKSLREPAVGFGDDIWLNLATEERSNTPKSSIRSRSSHTSVRSRHASRSASSTFSSVDNVLDDFITTLQGVYSEFFLLAKSPLDDEIYEICNVSPTVFNGGEHINGHVSKTPPRDIEELSDRLAQDFSFSMEVKWGNDAKDMRLYCIPLYGQASITWLCFLVETTLPALW